MEVRRWFPFVGDELSGIAELHAPVFETTHPKQRRQALLLLSASADSKSLCRASTSPYIGAQMHGYMDAHHAMQSCT